MSAATNYYVYGLGLLYEVDASENTKTYHYDYRGSTVALSDDSGNVTDGIEYSAYGTTTYRVGNTDTPFLMTATQWQGMSLPFESQHRSCFTLLTLKLS